MTLDDYKKALSSHDWFYHYSDDHSAFIAGERVGQLLKSLAKEGSDEFRQAYNEAWLKRFPGRWPFPQEEVKA